MEEGETPGRLALVLVEICINLIISPAADNWTILNEANHDLGAQLKRLTELSHEDKSAYENVITRFASLPHSEVCFFLV